MARISLKEAYDNKDVMAQIYAIMDRLENIPDDLATELETLSADTATALSTAKSAKSTADGLSDAVATAQSTAETAESTADGAATEASKAYGARPVSLATGFDESTRVLTTTVGIGDGTTLKGTATIPAGGGSEYTAGTAISIADGAIRVLYDDTTVKVNSNGQLYAVGGGGSGGSYTAGTGITISDSEIQANIDNDSIKANSSGALYATPYEAGAAISISSRSIGVMTDGTTIKLNDSGQLYAVGGGTDYVGLSPIDIQGNFISLLYDNDTIKVNASGALYASSSGGGSGTGYTAITDDNMGSIVFETGDTVYGTLTANTQLYNVVGIYTGGSIQGQFSSIDGSGTLGSDEYVSLATFRAPLYSFPMKTRTVSSVVFMGLKTHTEYYIEQGVTMEVFKGNDATFEITGYIPSHPS